MSVIMCAAHLDGGVTGGGGCGGGGGGSQANLMHAINARYRLDVLVSRAMLKVRCGARRMYVMTACEPAWCSKRVLLCSCVAPKLYGLWLHRRPNCTTGFTELRSYTLPWSAGSVVELLYCVGLVFETARRAMCSWTTRSSTTCLQCWGLHTIDRK
jgi:hypothetical protein